MCDYSLEHYRTRPARVGERYVTHRFPTRTIGFVAPGDCETAVCMAADTRLRVDGIPADLGRKIGVGTSAEVTVIRLERSPYLHRDAIRFDNGVELALQALGEGVSAYIAVATDAAATTRQEALV